MESDLEQKQKIIQLALAYFDTVARYEAESAIDSTGQLYLGTGLKMQEDWKSLRSAVEDYQQNPQKGVTRGHEHYRDKEANEL